jgi:hypothetical protein
MLKGRHYATPYFCHDYSRQQSLIATLAARLIYAAAHAAARCQRCRAIAMLPLRRRCCMAAVATMPPCHAAISPPADFCRLMPIFAIIYAILRRHSFSAFIITSQYFRAGRHVFHDSRIPP